MRVLLLGANGQVGREVQKESSGFNEIQIKPLARTDLDITDRTAVKDLISSAAPDLIINAAAYTAVDKAEEESNAAFMANRDAPLFMAESCRELNIPLFHISTDYVFDGTGNNPYPEDSAVNPIGVYGRSKLAGEAAIRDILDHHIILRTSWVFSVHGANFVKTMLRLGKEKKELRIVNDQRGCPTPAADIASVLLRLADKLRLDNTLQWGTYHYCGAPAVSWYDFAEAIFNEVQRLGGPSPKLLPIPSSAFPTPARRPLYSVLDCAKLAEIYGITQRAWLDNLKEVISQLIDREKSP